MKVLKYISMFAAAALLMTSCHEDEKVMALPADEVSAPVMNTLSNIVVDDATLQNEVTLSWSSVDYGYPAAVTYAVFASYQDVDVQIGEAYTTSYTMTKELLNNSLVDKKGLAVPEGANATVFFYVVANISAGNEAYAKRSNAIQVDITTVKSTSAPWIRRCLWVRGMHQGWNDQDAPVLWENGENTNVYEGLVYLVNPDDPTGTCEFKFCPENPGWIGNYGGSLDALSTEGNPANLTTTSGMYWITVDLGSLSAKLSPASAISVIGGVFDSSWGVDLDLTPAGLPDPSTQGTDADYNSKFYQSVIAQTWTGVYENTAAGEYKFRLNHDWAMSWGKDLEHLVLNDPTNLVTDLSGKVRFSINFKGDVESLLQDDTNPSPVSGKVEQAE